MKESFRLETSDFCDLAKEQDLPRLLNDRVKERASPRDFDLDLERFFSYYASVKVKDFVRFEAAVGVLGLNYFRKFYFSKSQTALVPGMTAASSFLQLQAGRTRPDKTRAVLKQNLQRKR